MKRITLFSLTILLSALMFSTTTLAQQRFVSALNGIQEVPPVNTPGSGTCMITLNTAETQITTICSYFNLTSNVVGAHIHGNAPPGQNAGILFNFNFTGGTSGTFSGTFNVTPAQLTAMRSKLWYVNIHTQQFPNGEIRGQIKQTNTVFDRDGDGRTDITVFRQSANAFYTLSSVTNTLMGERHGTGTGDFWLNNTADFDGDGRGDPLLIKLTTVSTDVVVANWSILQSSSNAIRNVQWGNFAASVGDTLAIGDYDGNGQQDIAVFRRSTGVWYINQSGSPRYEVWGAPGDFPSVGDYDGDGRSDLAVVRAESGRLVWYIRQSSNNQMRVFTWGASATDGVYFFAPLDFDGDGKQDITVSRTVNGQRVFFILRSSDNQPMYLTWGVVGATSDTTLFGDYDGDGRTDIVARRVISGQMYWFILQSSNNYNTAQHRTVPWGTTGDQLVEESEELPIGSSPE